jgi:hypothetical protein
MAVTMNRLLPPIEDSSTHWINWGKRPTIQTTIVFVGEHNYEQPHTNDGILDIEGQHPTKQIVSKCLSQNIITTLCGTNTLETEEGHNNDDNDINIPDEAIEAPNDSEYHEPRPQHPNSTINHLPRS